MTDLRTAAQMALDALTIFREWEMGQDYNSNRETVLARAFKAEETLRTALAQGEQEPHGYLWFTRHMEQRFTHRIPKEYERIGDVKPVYTAPPKREWQGLTDEEVSLMAFNECAEDWNDLRFKNCWIDGYNAGSCATQAKLKEKNT